MMKGIANPESSDSVESQEGISLPKRQKLSPNGIRTASDERDDCSPSVIIDVNNTVSYNNLLDRNPTNIGKLTTPDSTVKVPQTCP
jgi:hypothetical protein